MQASSEEPFAGSPAGPGVHLDVIILTGLFAESFLVMFSVCHRSVTVKSRPLPTLPPVKYHYNNTAKV